MRSHQPSLRNQGAPVLVTRGLTKAYGHRLAVNGLDLEVRAGEVFGFLGPNGAGKTTTIRMLAGLVRPTRGGSKSWASIWPPTSLRSCPGSAH